MTADRPIIIAAALFVAATVLLPALGRRTRRKRKTRRRGKVEDARTHVWRRESAAKAFAKIRRGDIPRESVLAYLRKTDPLEFEEIILLSLRAEGYRTGARGAYSGDGGVDGIASRGGVTYVVQCKRYSGHISAQDVRRLEGECSKRGCGGLFIHTGRTGKGSREVVGTDYSRVKIISGEALVNLVSGTEGQRLSNQKF